MAALISKRPLSVTNKWITRTSQKKEQNLQCEKNLRFVASHQQKDIYIYDKITGSWLEPYVILEIEVDTHCCIYSISIFETCPN